MHYLKIKSFPMRQNWDFFALLLFAYFVTLHADQLHLVLGGYTLRLNNFIAFILLILVLARLRTHLFSIPKKLALSLILIAISLSISCMLSPFKTRCVLYLGWYGLTILCYVLLPYWIVQVSDVSKIISLYKASFICVGIYAALQLFLSCVHLQDPFTTQWIVGHVVRPNAFCFEPSFYALYMTPFVFLFNALFINSKISNIWGLCLVNFLYLISMSAAVFFAYGLFFLILLCIRGFNRKRILKFFLGFCSCSLSLLIFFPFMMKHFFLKFYYFGFMAHHSFLERWIGIENGLKIFVKHPFFGVGLGGYPCYIMEAFLQGDNTFIYLGGFSRVLDNFNPIKSFEAMCVLTELLASLGIIGLFAFGSLIYSLFALVRCLPESEKTNAYCWLVSFFVMVVILQFNQGIFRTYIWVHFSMTYAYLEKITSKTTIENHASSTLHYIA